MPHPRSRPHSRPTRPAPEHVLDSRAPSLRPAVRRSTPPPPPRVSIARVLNLVPWHPYVWLYRALASMSAVTLMGSLLVFSLPTWSEAAGLFLGDMDRANGYQFPSFLLFMGCFGAWCSLQVYRAVVRVGWTYPPLSSER
ncbi:MAG: hypothetical protein ACI8PZ_002568 [Myxococcota bacterium]